MPSLESPKAYWSQVMSQTPTKKKPLGTGSPILEPGLGSTYLAHIKGASGLIFLDRLSKDSQQWRLCWVRWSQDLISAFFKNCGSVGFMKQIPHCTGALHSQIRSAQHENKHKCDAVVLNQKGWSAHSWSSWEEALGLSQDTLERVYLFGLGMLQFPPRRVGGSFWEEESLCISA